MPAFYSNWLKTISDVQAVSETEHDCKPGTWKNCTGLKAAEGTCCGDTKYAYNHYIGTVADTCPHVAGLYGNRYVCQTSYLSIR